MKKEVQSAVEFLAKLLRKRNVNADKVENFAESFEGVLFSHYRNHWFPEKPFKGSGYRCMRIVNQKMDPLIARAGEAAGLSELDLLSMLPTELTLWVDPEEVSYRIGEEGSIGVLFDSQSTATDGPPPVGSSDAESVSSGSLSSSPTADDYLPYPEHLHHHQLHHQSALFSGSNNSSSSSHYAGPPLLLAPTRAYTPPQDTGLFPNHWGDYLSTFVAS